ncbi:Glycosyltransferase family 10 (fucosyltransferase) C-term [Pelomyxa schiedti]|nr:Glycosyltransferase family 10 (fucosyltransferase) C-term [Pelomyxa schiedti]
MRLRSWLPIAVVALVIVGLCVPALLDFYGQRKNEFLAVIASSANKVALCEANATQRVQRCESLLDAEKARAREAEILLAAAIEMAKTQKPPAQTQANVSSCAALEKAVSDAQFRSLQLEIALHQKEADIAERDALISELKSQTIASRLPPADSETLQSLQKKLNRAQWYADNEVSPLWNKWASRSNKPAYIESPRSRSKSDPIRVVFMDGEMHLTVFDFANSKWKLDQCPVPCVLSKKAEDAAQGHVLFWHFDKPAPTTYPKSQSTKQVLALFTLEPEWVEGSKEPGFLESVLFNPDHPVDMLVGYPQQADVWVTYASNYVRPSSNKATIPPKNAIAAFVSNCNSQYRKDYMILLSKYFQLDSFGSCPWHSPGLPTTAWAKYGEQDKLRLQSEYRFVFGFENSILPDYATEKYYHLLSSPGIGIYAGPPNINDYYPTTGTPVLRADDYASPMDLVNKIKELSDDDTKYLEFQNQWRSAPARPFFENNILKQSQLEGIGAESWLCRVCHCISFDNCKMSGPGQTSSSAVPSSSLSSSYSCDECMTAAATLFCAQCGGVCLCASCSASLHASRVARAHVVRGVGERAQAPPVCRVHGEPMKLWCATDSAPVCWVCREGGGGGGEGSEARGHAGHRVVLVGAAVEQAVAELGAALGEASKTADEARSALGSSAAGPKDQASVAAAKVDAVFGELHAKLEERCAKLKAEIRQEAERLTVLHVANAANLQAAADQLNGAISEANRVTKIAKTEPYTALSVHGKVSRELRSACGATASAIRSNPPIGARVEFQVVESSDAALKRDIDAFGKVPSLPFKEEERPRALVPLPCFTLDHDCCGFTKHGCNDACSIRADTPVTFCYFEYHFPSNLMCGSPGFGVVAADSFVSPHPPHTANQNCTGPGWFCFHPGCSYHKYRTIGVLVIVGRGVFFWGDGTFLLRIEMPQTKPVYPVFTTCGSCGAVVRINFNKPRHQWPTPP